MTTQSSIILTYKGKILLFSYDVSLYKTDNVWDFLKVEKKGSKNIIDFLRKEINLPSKLKQEEIKVDQIVASDENGLQLFHFKLTDEYVNGIDRRNRWRLEFYQFNELEKISFSNEAQMIYTKYKDLIKSLLSA